MRSSLASSCIASESSAMDACVAALEMVGAPSICCSSSSQRLSSVWPVALKAERWTVSMSTSISSALW